VERPREGNGGGENKRKIVGNSGARSGRSVDDLFGVYCLARGEEGATLAWCLYGFYEEAEISVVMMGCEICVLYRIEDALVAQGSISWYRKTLSSHT
jgi:hypothetical protein